MKVSKQEAAILATFLAVVVVVTGGYIWYTTRPQADARPTQTASSDLARQEAEIRALDTVSVLLDEQRIDSIVRSGVFGAPTTEGALDVLPGARAGVAVETTRVVEVLGREPDGEEPASGGPITGPAMPTGPTVITRQLDAIDVAITGVVVGAGTARALVFSNADEEGKWIDVPGEAYGYQVEYVTMKGAVVSKDDRTYVLLLGANRKETADYSVAGTPGAPAPQAPGPGQGPGGQGPGGQGPGGPGQMGPGMGGFGPPPGGWGGPPGGFRGGPPGGFGGGPPGGFGGGRGGRGGRGG